MLQAVGKSTLMNKIMRRNLKEEHEPTIGVDFGSFVMKINGKSVKLQIWDTVITLAHRYSRQGKRHSYQ